MRIDFGQALEVDREGDGVLVREAVVDHHRVGGLGGGEAHRLVDVGQVAVVVEPRQKLPAARLRRVLEPEGGVAQAAELRRQIAALAVPLVAAQAAAGLEQLLAAVVGRRLLERSLVAAVAVGLQEGRHEDRLLPVAAVFPRQRGVPGRGASLAVVTDRAAEALGVVVVQVVARMGLERRRAVGEARIFDRHVAGDAAVDAVHLGQVDLAQLDREVGTGL